MQSKLRHITPFVLPVGLIVLGVYLLIGCIPIPATRQLQPDWRPRPETAVGTGGDKPIQPGRTSITDAFIVISTRIGATKRGSGGLLSASIETPAPGQWSMQRWLVSEDHRRFAARYQIRTSTVVYPLCFHLDKQTEDRWLLLDVNDEGIVTATRTVAEHPRMPALTVQRCFEVFDEPARRQLQAAGVLPADEVLRQAAAMSPARGRTSTSPGK